MKFFLFLLLLIFNSSYLIAQENQAKVGIDEIIVSAEFNENNPFNLPLSVSVLSTEEKKRQSSRGFIIYDSKCKLLNRLF